MSGVMMSPQSSTSLNRRILNGKEIMKAGMSVGRETEDGSFGLTSPASRVMTALDEMLDTLINRTGIVGR